ncbi:hypothetical protein KCP78_18200 [Salmonella enterica subsp. enterica]|nr:hypothetical protein KCP78_18200 [Salmonella enterica subsp. enterica]
MVGALIVINGAVTMTVVAETRFRTHHLLTLMVLAGWGRWVRVAGVAVFTGVT